MPFLLNKAECNAAQIILKMWKQGHLLGKQEVCN